MSAKFFVGNKDAQCAADIFMQGISKIDRPNNSTTFVGESCGKEFVLDSINSFQWGNRKSHYRQLTAKVDLPYNGGMSSIALESLYAFLDEAYKTGKIRNTYRGLMGNDMSNNIAQGLDFNPDWVEIVTRGQNTGHGNLWHSIFKATGLRVVFSAINYDFRKYIEECQGDLTTEYVKEYTGIYKVLFRGLEYWEVS